MHERPTILLPVGVLEGESIPEGVPGLLSKAHVVLLGYHVVPDQTATDQARKQFQDQALRRLDDFTGMLEDAGATVESTLVFTHDKQTTFDRISGEHDCLAVLIPNATRSIENVLVAVRGVVGIDRFVELVSGLFAPDDGEPEASPVRSDDSSERSESLPVSITLYHVAGSDETDADVETLLDGIATRISENGVPRDRIDLDISRGDDHQDQLVDATDDYDAVVMGESDPSVTTFLFGMTADQIAKQFLGPVFVIQHEEPVSDDDLEIE